jgi:hypothetical protein
MEETGGILGGTAKTCFDRAGFNLIVGTRYAQAALGRGTQGRLSLTKGEQREHGIAAPWTLVPAHQAVPEPSCVEGPRCMARRP